MTYIEHLDDKFDFGKFSDCPFAEVIKYNPEYISWVVKNVSGSICVFCDSVIEELRIMFPQFETSSSFETMRHQRIAEFEDLKDDYYNVDRFDDYKLYDKYESPTYEQYISSYAQDEMVYSDDDIDTILDGDPDAYWNID